jgi:hypothetical protein
MARLSEGIKLASHSQPNWAKASQNTTVLPSVALGDYWHQTPRVKGSNRYLTMSLVPSVLCFITKYVPFIRASRPLI